MYARPENETSTLRCKRGLENVVKTCFSACSYNLFWLSPKLLKYYPETSAYLWGLYKEVFKSAAPDRQSPLSQSVYLLCCISLFKNLLVLCL